MAGEPKDKTEQFEEFIKHFKRYDRWRRSGHSLERATNWILAINIGTLFLLVGNFGKFVVSGAMPLKPLFLLSALFLGFSIVDLAFCRALLYLRELGMNMALERFEGLPERIQLKIGDKTKKEMESKTKEELEEMVEQITKSSSGLWVKAHNLMDRAFPLIISGLVFYVLGVLLLAIYVVTFIVKYL